MFLYLLFSIGRQFNNGSAITSNIGGLGTLGQHKSSVITAQDNSQLAQKSYGIPTIKLLNPELYKEMEKTGNSVKDPIYQSLKNIKERHTYLENRQQRIDKRNAEIASSLKQQANKIY